jgi:hypothetical protein
LAHRGYSGLAGAFPQPPCSAPKGLADEKFGLENGRFLQEEAAMAPNCASAAPVACRTAASDVDGRHWTRGVSTTLGAIGASLEMPAAEATVLLSRRQWREGDVALLEIAVARLALPSL